MPATTAVTASAIQPFLYISLAGSDCYVLHFYGLVAGGVRVHPYAVAPIAHATHRDPAGLRVVLVTDAMQAMGLPTGRHQLGGLDVDICDGLADGHYEGLHAVLTGTATLAGAVEPLDACQQKSLAFTGCSLAEGLCAVMLRPALPRLRAACTAARGPTCCCCARRTCTTTTTGTSRGSSSSNGRAQTCC